MTNETDIIIIGGGMAGMTTAIGMAMSGFDVTVVDHTPRGDMSAGEFDGRSSALSYAPCQLFKALDIWKYLEDVAQPILEIRITDGPSPLHLHFDNESLGDGPLGNMVENRHTRLALFKRMDELDNITYLAPEKVVSFNKEPSNVSVTLDSGKVIEGKLLLGIDGRNSQVRKWAGFHLHGWGYGQTGIVCTIEHEHSHCGIAHERFLPSGPFAILPLTGNRSSIVWSEKDHLVDTIMGLSDRAFESELQRRVGDFLGKVSVVGGRFAYPLTLQYCDEFVSDRVTLVGDACHGMHPIAGQGLNLGLRDVAAIVEVVTDAARAGLDIGSVSVLEEYQQWRRVDNAALLSVTDVLTKLFSNDIAPIRHARDLGIAVVDQVEPLKNVFMQHARGTVGELPKLLQGERP